MQYFIGIDAGGTSCRARLVDAQGRVLGSGRAGAANLRVGAEQAFREIEAACGEAAAMAGLAASDLSRAHAGIGIAGISRPGARNALLAQPLPFRSTGLVSDAQIALLGAHSGQDGAIVIVGTGSIGLARVDGAEFTVGGYGFPVSDGGSGADIGLRAVRKALQAHDGRIAPSPLTAEVLERFNGSPAEIIRWMDGATATDYATLAPVVVRHAGHGDPVGRIIMTKAAWHVETMVRALVDRGAPQCAMIGGLSREVSKWLPPDIRAFLKDPDADPLDGALILARSIAHQPAGTA
ncbi:MAG TPA: BadF/BadG/BcrA/BcrD ATPase family protein [Azospirillaceae bacterium]|nr:BadF/BadG/BcrA/BcrD ATPase family protein [Azospirillaceae bacterium]